MKLKLSALALCAMPLAACATTADPTSFERISAGLPFDQARAYCNIASNGVQQGVIAFGSPSYVAGAQLGNAIGNAIRTEQFMKDCMTLQGWKYKAKRT